MGFPSHACAALLPTPSAPCGLRRPWRCQQEEDGSRCFSSETSYRSGVLLRAPPPTPRPAARPHHSSKWGSTACRRFHVSTPLWWVVVVLNPRPPARAVRVPTVGPSARPSVPRQGAWAAATPSYPAPLPGTVVAKSKAAPGRSTGRCKKLSWEVAVGLFC